MKTKHILTALALPAMFAACTADDIEGLNNGMQQMPERALLSEDFVLNINNGVESRYQVNGTTGLDFVFEANDSIGANVIDAPKYEGGEWVKDPAEWDILAYVSPALPFVKDGSVWKSAGRLGVGNYLFTNPYNPEDGGRLAAKYELPVVVQYDSKNPNAHIEKYNKAVAADVLNDGQLAANTSLKNIFTYPKIRIKFNKTYEVSKITKIVLANEDGSSFTYKGGLDHYSIVKMFNKDNIADWLEENKEDNLTEADYWAQFETTDFILDGNYATGQNERNVDLKYGDTKTTPYFIYEMNEAVVANTFEVRLMLPSIADFYNYTATDVVMYVCTDKGNYKFDLTDFKNYDFNKATVNSKIAKALTRNASNTLTTLETALVPAEKDEIFFDNIVSTVEDWNLLVAKYGNLKKYAADAKASDREYFKVNIIDSEFAFTEETKMPEVAEFIVLTNASVEGNVTLKNIKIQDADITDEKVPTLTVKEGATLTTDPTFIAPVVNVEKDANLVFTAAYDSKKKLAAYDEVKKVVNKGTVTVPAGVIAEFELENAKDAIVNVGAAASRAAEVQPAVANLKGENDGIINNYGEINVIAGANANDIMFANNAPSDDASTGNGYKWDEDEEVWNGAPTINNDGTFNAKGKTVNNGMFNNNGELSSNFVGQAFFYNGTAVSGTKPAKHYTAVLNVGENAKTYIDENTNGAEIILAKLEPANFTIFKGKEASAYGTANLGVVKYVMNDKANNEVELKDSPVTHLISNVGITLKNSYDYLATSATVTTPIALPVLEVNGGTLKVSTTKNTKTTPEYVAPVTKLIVNGEVLIDGEIATISNIQINANSKLGVPAGAKLSISTLADVTTLAGEEDDDKVGVLAVNGSLHLTSSSVANATEKYTGTLKTATGIGTYYEVTRNSSTERVYVDLNKDAAITVNKPAGDTTANGREVTYTSGTLNDSWNTWFGNDANDFVKKLTINGELDMSVVDDMGTTAETDDVKNSSKTAVFNKAVVLGEGGSIVKLTKAMGVSSESLTVEADATIQGTKDLDIYTTDALTVKSGATLTIDGGWLIIDITTPVLGQNCEAITIEEGAYVNGVIAAKHSTSGEYFFWNASTSKWVKASEDGTIPSNSSVVILGATPTAGEVKAALADVNVKSLVVESIETILNVKDNNNVVDLKGKIADVEEAYSINQPVTFKNGTLKTNFQITNNKEVKFVNVVFGDEFTGSFPTGDNTYAHVAQDAGNVTFEDCKFYMDGVVRPIVMAPGMNNKLTIKNCEFIYEGSNAGYSSIPYFNGLGANGEIVMTGNTFDTMVSFDMLAADFTKYTISGNTFEEALECFRPSKSPAAEEWTFLSGILANNEFEGNTHLLVKAADGDRVHNKSN